MRNIFRHILAALLATAIVAGQAFAQGYPNKLLRVIVPHSAGSSPDVVTRLVAQKLSERLGQPVVIDNRVGAGGSIGLGQGAKSPADGYTLIIGHVGTLTINPNIYTNLTYDSVKDFSPVTLSATTPLLVVVSAESPYKSMADIIAAAKANPGKITFSSAGNGTASHMSGVLFAAMTGVELFHVPYKSAPAALTAVMGGDVTLTFGGQPAAWPLVRANKLRAMALTSGTRVAEFPDVPIVAETVAGYEVLDWNGFMVPAGTPSEIVRMLNKELVQIINEPGMIKQLRGLGLHPAAGTPEQFAERIGSERQKWARVAKNINLKLD